MVSPDNRDGSPVARASYDALLLRAIYSVKSPIIRQKAGTLYFNGHSSSFEPTCSRGYCLVLASEVACDPGVTIRQAGSQKRQRTVVWSSG